MDYVQGTVVGNHQRFQFDGVQHSRLVQKKIRKPVDQASAFQAAGSEIPLVLVPRWPLLFHFNVNVPSGVYVMYQKFHKDQGQLAAGVKWFWPAWYRISHIVTRQAVTYNAPTYSIPTADAVQVDINLSLTFRIGPDFDSAREFVYKLGPQRLDDLLSAKVDESIRGLVYTVTHDSVNDLREEFAGDMLSSLNAVLSRYGVQVMNVKVTDVQLPRELQERLERTTGFKTRIEEQEKGHDNQVRIVSDNAEQKVTTIKKTNARRIQELNAEIARYEIELTEMEARVRGIAHVDLTNARSSREVSLTKAQGEEEASKIAAQREAEKRVRQAEIDANSRKIDADRRADVLVKRSEAELISAQNKAKAMIAQAEAELKSIKNLSEKRRFDVEWRRLNVLGKLAGKGRRFVSGKAGMEMMQGMAPRKADAAAFS